MECSDDILIVNSFVIISTYVHFRTIFIFIFFRKSVSGVPLLYLQYLTTAIFGGALQVADNIITLLFTITTKKI